MLFRPHPVLRALTRCGAAAALALGAASVSAVAHPDEETGALMGDLVFHADLMVSLDTLCRVKAPARDWQAVLGALPADVRTPELRDISRRLSADAAKSMVRGSGGCNTRQFAQVYAETRIEYESLLEQWAMLSV